MTPANGVEPSPPQELPPCRRHHVSVIATTSLGPQGPSCLLPVSPPFLCTRPPPAHWEVVVCSPGALPPIVIDVMLSSSPPAPTTACCCVLYRNSDIAPFFTLSRHVGMTKPVHQMCGFGVLQPSERVVENFY